MIVTQKQNPKKKKKKQKTVIVPNGCRQLPKETLISTKNTMTRTTDNSKHFAKDSSAAGLDVPQVDNRHIEEPVKGS